MHTKSDSAMTSQAASSPPQSPSRYMTSPTHSHHDADGVSIVGSSPGASPLHPNYHHHLRYGSSPIQHFRDSSASLKHASSWRKIHNDHQHAHYHHGAASSDFSESDDDDDGRVPVRCFAAWFALGSILLFTLFSLVLWGASKSYKPAVFVKGVMFQSYLLQAGTDVTGVSTKMLSINSTVSIALRNPATFFSVHTSSTPLVMYYSELKIASGYMEEFNLSQRRGRVVVVAVGGRQMPLYGGGSSLTSRAEEGGAPTVVPLQLSFTVRSRAHLLGHLVTSEFHRHVRCSLALRKERLGEPLDLADDCQYGDG
ncbi:Late embryogenesis abundant protein [Musa troglodytarum]|uniref:Late embryogenesis abundant protein n=1 Tax=Musa troglodytarum TaxID=320322 RepID=A0A9E7EIA4_9LILI|nr:Late embryogenesis abundant protein [Musa troglodytarum]